MNITFDNPDLSLETPVLRERYRCSFALELTTMKGDIRRVAGDIWLTVPNTRDALPAEPTLHDLIKLVLRRQHPVMEYIAEQNGVKVCGYYEHPLPRRLWNIEYDESGMACRMYL